MLDVGDTRPPAIHLIKTAEMRVRGACLAKRLTLIAPF